MDLSLRKLTKGVSCVGVVQSTHTESNYVKSLIQSGDSVQSIYMVVVMIKLSMVKNYKGALDYDGKCKLRGLVDYEYSIVLENSQQKKLLHGKISRRVSYLGTVPLYWGCPNIIDLLPKNSYHLVNTNIDNPIGEITKLINKPYRR